ncbi:antitoxin Xre/MbcA/ParS toxin-binding domain-containing protein [Gluconacetobacter takamatsuzukensis]|uniref:antitoxin Xre/MbcA/ParS toxin-binding domain-containing protein n=1 Tax=Gluconacetobacter takamatsuzukensis TaxID=1286190 RepID=UPI001C7FBCFC
MTICCRRSYGDWYRSRPVPSFGDQTAEALVREGRAEAVRRYLDRIATGGYA